jgi:diguanylate cyclase (GGDEF)-like protein/PAS domain S-box-containing protein
MPLGPPLARCDLRHNRERRRERAEDESRHPSSFIGACVQRDFVDRQPDAPVSTAGEVQPAAVATPSTDRSAWALAASVATDGLWYVQLPDGDVHLSPRALELLGYGAEDAGPRMSDLAAHVDASHIGVLRDAMRALGRGDRSRFELEIRTLTRGGERRWMLVRARAKRVNGALVVAGTLADIDRRKRSELALREELRRDPLTGLPNRAALSEWLTARVARAATSPASRFAVLYIDLDRFKIVNDSLGHASGDALLVETAQRLSATLAADDLLARVGGDEFVILLDEIDDEGDAEGVAISIQERMRTGIMTGGREVFASLSIGVRTSGPWSMKPSDLLRDADVAMYHAKRRGGARSVLFDQSMFDESAAKFRVQSELPQALERDELALAYQPIFHGADARLCGFEALARWNHPTRGRLTATEFVDAAAESGVIVQIGRWVMTEACRQLADWHDAYPDSGPLRVAINLCERELLDPHFAASVESALAASGLPASSLVLEMTEHALMTHGELAVPALRRLRALGVQIQLDDFGRGYSSLSALRRMPLTAVKIAPSLIAGIVVDAGSRAVVGSMAAFARALGLDVVAEGVETREQAAMLSAMGGFTFVQGHFYGEPGGPDDAAALIGSDGAGDVLR